MNEKEMQVLVTEKANRSFFVYAEGRTLVYRGRHPEAGEHDLAWAITLAKWKTITEAKPGEIHFSGGAMTCGLCMLYWGCDGDSPCPIYTYTGETGCRGSPFNDYRNAILAGDDECALAHSSDEWELLWKLWRQQEERDVQIDTSP